MDQDHDFQGMWATTAQPIRRLLRGRRLRRGRRVRLVLYLSLAFYAAHFLVPAIAHAAGGVAVAVVR